MDSERIKGLKRLEAGVKRISVERVVDVLPVTTTREVLLSPPLKPKERSFKKTSQGA